MELQNIFQKKLERKKFFMSLGAGFAGFIVLKSFPFKLFNKAQSKKKINSEQVKIKINPLAVSRKNIGGNNGRS